MSEPGVQCPLCKRVCKIVRWDGDLRIESHNWHGAIGDLVDRLACVQYSARCPMSEAPVTRNESKTY